MSSSNPSGVLPSAVAKTTTRGGGILISTLAPTEVLFLTGAADIHATDEVEILEAYVAFYDQRGGAVEIEIKEDKQGLSTAKRNKRRGAAQQMLTQLEILAHNTLVWARSWLVAACPKLACFSHQRLIREVLHLNGRVIFDHYPHFHQLILNAADPLAALTFRDDNHPAKLLITSCNAKAKPAP